MNGNFLDGGEVDVRTVSYDNTDYNNLNETALTNTDSETKETVYIRLSRWFLCAGIFLLPLFFLPWTTSILELNKQLLLLVLAGVTLILWLLHVVVSGQMSWHPNSVDKGIIGMLVAVSFTTIFSVVRFKSLFGLPVSLSDSLVTVLALSIFYFGVVNLFDDRGSRIRTFLGCSLFLVLVFGVLQMLGLSPFRYFDVSIFKFATAKAFNTVGSVNSLGVIAAASLPLFYKSKQTSFIKYFNIVGIFLSLGILVILNWWVLWTIAIAGMATVIALDSLSPAHRSNTKNIKISKFLLPMTVIILAVFLMIINFNINFPKKDLPTEIAPSFNLSVDIAKSIMVKNIAFGNGPENFSLAFDQYGARKLANTTLSGAKFFDSTSQVLNWAVQGGLTMLAALAFVLWLLIRGMFTPKYRNIEILSEDAGVISGAVALIVGMFLYPFNITLMFVSYVVIGLTVVSLWGNEKRLFNVEERATTSLISSLGFIGGLILVLVGSYFGAALYISDTKYAQALSSENREEAMNLLNDAINWNSQDDRYYRISSLVALDFLSVELNKKDENNSDKTAKVQSYLSSAINLAKRATEVSSRESSNWSNLGDVYQKLVGLVDGVDKLAEDSYLKAAELRPGDASFYNKIGSMYLAKSDLSRQLAASGGANAAKFQKEIVSSLIKAEENFKKAIDLSSNFGLAIYNLGAVYDRMGKVREAIGQLEKIAPYNSNQPTLAFELGLLYYRDNQKDKAFSQLQRAVLLSPNFANARWYLGLLYEERQDIPNAIDQMKNILGIDANKDNQIVLTKLDELQRGTKTIPPKKVIDQKPL
ncbi:MAG TPA: hypothetical protein VJC06_01390 [Candidatus Paceibacterota bacterium]